MNCYQCYSKKIERLYKIHKYNIYRCNNCEFVFVYPLLSSHQVQKIYKQFKKNIFEKSSIIYYDAKHSLDYINRYRGTRKTLLDIGCGSGIFLEEAKKKMWDVTGIDMSSKMIAYIKRHNNYRVIKGNILSAKIINNYDLLSLNQVIEHFVKPRLLIQRCNKLLNNNGLIYIATPNISSYVSKIRKKEFDYIIPPEHLSYFNKKSLTYLLVSEGFRVIKFNTWSYPVDLAGLIKYIFGIRKSKKFDKTTQLSKNILDIKSIKYLLFDQILCRAFYKMLNFNNGGTMIEVLAQKI